MGIFLVILSLIIAVVIVNLGQQLFMKAMGADTMYYSMKGKLIVILIVWVILGSIMFNSCGVH